MSWYAGYVQELCAFPKPTDTEEVNASGHKAGTAWILHYAWKRGVVEWI
jgi:hypothetical protein